MALSPEDQRRVSELSTPDVAFPLIFAAITAAAAGRSVVTGSLPPGALLPAVLLTAFLVAVSIGARRRPRVGITKRALIVKAKGRTRVIPWHDVEHLTRDREAVRARVRIDGELEDVVAHFAPKSPGADFAKAPLFVGGADVELANGTRVAIGVAAAVVGAVLAAFGTWVGTALGTNAWWWIAALGLGYGGMTLWTLSRSRVTARADGLWVNGRVIPWRAIEGAAPRVTPDHLSAPTQIRVYLEGSDQLTVSVGAGADTAVAEILRRRDLARLEAQGRE